MQTVQDRAKSIIEEMEAEIANKGPARIATCRACQSRFTAYADTQVLCSRVCKDQYLESLHKNPKPVDKETRKPLSFSVTNRFLGGEKVYSKRETLDWLRQQPELDTGESYESLKIVISKLSVSQGTDAGDYWIVRIQ